MSKRRINIALNNKQIAFVDKLREGIKNSKNRDLSKDDTINYILKAVKGLKIKTKGGIKSEKELEKRILNEIKKGG